MNIFLEPFSDKINGTFSFFDRIIIKGQLLQPFSLSGHKYFFTNQIVSYGENMALSMKRPFIYLTSAKQPKEQAALDVSKNNLVSEGLIYILSVVEGCQTFQPVKLSDGLINLRSTTRKCKYYYFYFLDKNFGFMHVKLQIWFPFLIQWSISIDGR